MAGLLAELLVLGTLQEGALQRHVVLLAHRMQTHIAVLFIMLRVVGLRLDQEFLLVDRVLLATRTGHVKVGACLALHGSSWVGCGSPIEIVVTCMRGQLDAVLLKASIALHCFTGRGRDPVEGLRRSEAIASPIARLGLLLPSCLMRMLVEHVARTAFVLHLWRHPVVVLRHGARVLGTAPVVAGELGLVEWGHFAVATGDELVPVSHRVVRVQTTCLLRYWSVR